MFEILENQVSFPIKLCPIHRIQVTHLKIQDYEIIDLACQRCCEEAYIYPQKTSFYKDKQRKCILIEKFHEELSKKFRTNLIKIQQIKKLNFMEVQCMVKNRKKQIQNNISVLIQQLTQKLLQQKKQLFEKLDKIEGQFTQCKQQLQKKVNKKQHSMKYIESITSDIQIFRAKLYLQERSSINQFLSRIQSIQYLGLQCQEWKATEIIRKMDQIVIQSNNLNEKYLIMEKNGVFGKKNDSIRPQVNYGNISMNARELTNRSQRSFSYGYNTFVPSQFPKRRSLEEKSKFAQYASKEKMEIINIP